MVLVLLEFACKIAATAHCTGYWTLGELPVGHCPVALSVPPPGSKGWLNTGQFCAEPPLFVYDPTNAHVGWAAEGRFCAQREPHSTKMERKCRISTPPEASWLELDQLSASTIVSSQLHWR